MHSQYDSFARSYGKVARSLALRKHVEFFTFFKVLGDVEGKAILDAGCGTGMYTRQLRQRGAARVLGLDGSVQMIEVARAAEREEPLGIEYVLADLADAGPLGAFDVVTAGYVLPHADTAARLLEMCRAIHDALAPGGRFVGVLLSHSFQSTDPTYYSPYGMRIDHEGDLRDGSPVSVAVESGAVRFTIGAHHWSKEAYESALLGAGLTGIRWHRPEVSPAGVAEHGEAAWKRYLEHPHALLIECRK